jgi:hypothetical protein
MFKTDNSLHVFVGPQETSSIAAASAGDVFIVDETNAIISDGAITAAAHPYLKIGQKDADGNVRFTPLFKFANITSKVAREHDEDRSQQSSVFGSGGSTGSIEALNSNRYTIRVNFTNNVDMYSEQSDQHFFEYVSDSSATQIEIADYFAQTMSKSAKFSGKRTGKNRASVKVERFTSAADSAISTDITTATVTNGSKYITGFTFGSGTDVSGMVAGNYLRIVEEGTVTDTPVATTDAIYKIVSVDNTNDIIELDQPFQGTGAALQDVAINQITAAVMATADVGIRIMGLEQEWKLGLLPDAGNLITFEVTLDGWGATTAVANTAAVLGDGTARAVADLEWFAQGAAGAYYHKGAIPSNADNITLYADGTLTTSYNTLELQVDLEDPGHAVATGGKGKMTIVMAALEGASQALVTTALATTGDAWD